MIFRVRLTISVLCLFIIKSCNCWTINRLKRDTNHLKFEMSILTHVMRWYRVLLFCDKKKLLRSVSKTFFFARPITSFLCEKVGISDQQQTTRANKISDDVMIVIIITSNRQICGLFVPIHVRSSCCVRWCRRVEDVNNNISQQTKHRPYDNWESAAYLKVLEFPMFDGQLPVHLVSGEK